MKIRILQKISLISAIGLMLLVFFFSFLPHAQAAGLTIDPVYKVLGDVTQGAGKTVANVWSGLMNLMDSLVILVLIAVAFANILRYQLDSYSVKKFLPTFIMAIIAAHFSFLISRIIIDFANIIMSLFLFGSTSNKITGAFSSLIGTAPLGPDGYSGNYVGYIIGYIFKQSATCVGAVLVFILAFIFLIRNYLIYFLVAIAPLGFMAMVLPATKKYFQMWWSNFTKWVFMPVVSLFWLWLAGQFMSTFQGGSWLVSLAFAGLCFYMAITTPFKVGGAVTSAWAGWGKKAWGATGGQAVKGGKWVVGGGAASSYTAYAQMKAKTADKIGDTATKEKWERRARIGGFVNPKSYRQGFKERLAAANAAAESAVVKTGTYGKMAGPARQVQAHFDANKEDDLGAPAFDVGTRARKTAREILGSTNPKLRQYSEAMRTKAGERMASMRRMGYDLTGLNVDDFAGEELLNDIRITNNPAIADLYGGTEIDTKKAGELKSIANAFFRKTSNRDRPERDLAFFGRILTPPAGRRGPAAGTPTAGAPRPPSSAVPGIPGAVAPARPAEGIIQAVIPHMQELIDAFREFENKLGGEGTLGGKEGLDNFVSEMSKIKSEITPESLGLMLGRIGEVGVKIDRVDPDVLNRLMNATKRVQTETGRIGLGIETGNAQTLRNVFRVLQNSKTPEEGARNAEIIFNLSKTGEEQVTGGTAVTK